MRIKSKLTKKEFTVTREEWDLIGARGDMRKYTVLSHDNPTPVVEQPESVSDFKTLVNKANLAMTEERYEDSEALFLEAQQIKSTKLIEKKLKELGEILS